MTANSMKFEENDEHKSRQESRITYRRGCLSSIPDGTGEYGGPTYEESAYIARYTTLNTGSANKRSVKSQTRGGMACLTVYWHSFPLLERARERQDKGLGAA